MKTLLIYSTFILSCFILACSSSKTSADTVREITSKVENRDFTINVNYADPLRMKQVMLTSEYDLRIKNDSAFAYLPYFGVSYTAAFGSSDGGIKFAEPMIDYTSIPNKKSTGWDIHFKVKSKEYIYEIFINVFNNGNSTFSVISQQRDLITFNGEVKR